MSVERVGRLRFINQIAHPTVSANICYNQQNKFRSSILVIQAWWKGCLIRQRLELKAIFDLAATDI